MKTQVLRTGSRVCQGQAAFSLVEVLFAAILVVTLFISLYVGLSTGFSITQTERENLRATQIMLERMEGIRLFNWNQLMDTAKNPPTFTKDFNPSATGSDSRGIQYFGTVEVSTNLVLIPPATYSTNMRMITVTVRWNFGLTNQHVRSMSTYVSKWGMQNYIYNN
jgi:hypothetical protein